MDLYEKGSEWVQGLYDPTHGLRYQLPENVEEVAAEFHKQFPPPLGYVKKVFTPAPTAELMAPYTVKVHPDDRQVVSVQYSNRAWVKKPDHEWYKAGAYDLHFTGLFCPSRGGAPDEELKKQILRDWLAWLKTQPSLVFIR
ncbi:MAG TPA: hypothetical protein PLQ80_01945 [Candidatus Syntrophosphaera sp.]|nr:hypothetical protein [Candidatus Syntrophosphaera sp.]